MEKKVCTIKGCSCHSHARGVCKKHYNKIWYRIKKSGIYTSAVTKTVFDAYKVFLNLKDKVTTSVVEAIRDTKVIAERVINSTVSKLKNMFSRRDKIKEVSGHVQHVLC